MATSYSLFMTPGGTPFVPSKQTIVTSSATTPVQLSITNICEIQLGDDTELEFLEPVIGVYIFKVVQSVGSKDITWPGTVKWPGGSAPTLSTTQNKVDIITLVYDGNKFYGTYTLDF